MAEKEACRIPTTTEEHGLRTTLHDQGPMAIQPVEGSCCKPEAKVNVGLLLDQLLDVLNGPCFPFQAGYAQGKAIAGKDFGKALANHSCDAPASQCLGGMFTAGSAAKIAVDNQNPGPLVLRAIQGMSPPRCCAVISEGMIAQPREADAFQESSRDNAIRVNVMALKGYRLPFHSGDGCRCHSLPLVLPSRVRTSVTTPLTAAAATIAGLINKVRPDAEP